MAKGPALSVAREGALKIKETTYIHAEAICAGEMKHGPIAMIDSESEKETAVILIMLDDSRLHEMSLALSEVHSRDALTIVITDCLHKIDSSKVHLSIEIVSLAELTPLVSVIPFQVLSLQLARLKGINPDKPRNLAKTVTVG